MSGFETLRDLYRDWHESRCATSDCNCDREAAKNAWALYREILKENQE